jgi:hypothetical protein
MLLWVNLHGGFIVGFIITAVYILGNFFQGFFAENEKGMFGVKS